MFRFATLNILLGCSGLGVGRDDSQALAERAQAGALLSDGSAPWASLVAQWRVCPPIQEAGVRSLVWEDPARPDP